MTEAMAETMKARLEEPVRAAFKKRRGKLEEISALDVGTELICFGKLKGRKVRLPVFSRDIIRARGEVEPLMVIVNARLDQALKLIEEEDKDDRDGAGEASKARITAAAKDHVAPGRAD